MREIKFRAWDNGYFKPLEDDGDYYFQDYGDGLKLFNKFGECENVVLLQFTGLKDKNGKEIYEGDIVVDDIGKMREIRWNGQNAQFYLENDIRYKEFIECGQSQSDGAVCCDNIEIIGNIYENPKLLNPKQNALS